MGSKLPAGLGQRIQSKLVTQLVKPKIVPSYQKFVSYPFNFIQVVLVEKFFANDEKFCMPWHNKSTDMQNTVSQMFGFIAVVVNTFGINKNTLSRRIVKHCFYEWNLIVKEVSWVFVKFWSKPTITTLQYIDDFVNQPQSKVDLNLFV